MERRSPAPEHAERFGSDIVVLIPAYEPGPELPPLVERLATRFSRLVVVNDGSTMGLEYLAAVRPFVEQIIEHPVNRGKGAAIKSALAEIGSVDVVTADADGQHTVDDIVRVATALKSTREGLVLGVRSFTGQVPLRSRFGNWWTRIFFFLLTGLMIRDTQTGLRGIPASLVPRILALPGDRYEYEMVMLSDARHHAQRPLQIPIETIYLNDNRASHFSPLRDTIVIYRALFRSLWK